MLFSSTAVDSEDGVAIETPGNLTLDTDFLLEQDIHFDDPDHDSKILNLEKFRGLLNIFSPQIIIKIFNTVWFSHASLSLL